MSMQLTVENSRMQSIDHLSLEKNIIGKIKKG